jgi:hypothetical protein
MDEYQVVDGAGNRVASQMQRDIIDACDSIDLAPTLDEQILTTPNPGGCQPPAWNKAITACFCPFYIRPAAGASLLASSIHLACSRIDWPLVLDWPVDLRLGFRQAKSWGFDRVEGQGVQSGVSASCLIHVLGLGFRGLDLRVPRAHCDRRASRPNSVAACARAPGRALAPRRLSVCRAAAATGFEQQAAAVAPPRGAGWTAWRGE